MPVEDLFVSVCFDREKRFYVVRLKRKD